jgi:hypothetical protein
MYLAATSGVDESKSTFRKGNTSAYTQGKLTVCNMYRIEKPFLGQ